MGCVFNIVSWELNQKQWGALGSEFDFITVSILPAEMWI